MPETHTQTVIVDIRSHSARLSTWRLSSEADIKITSKLKEAAIIHCITLLDHLIITNDGYYSMADMGRKASANDHLSAGVKSLIFK